ncbi:MAG TPA: PQQ-dependent sugar dehydrogenase [Solirubrobacterales bacterium]|nr:PQQ-dependent sugar dehydrogenase [Solirubrobacterales bacterium]
MTKLRLIASAALLLLALAAVPAAKAAPALVPVGEFDEPIYVTAPPGDKDRLFVVERKGRIMRVQNGAATTFADLRGLVGCGSACSGERGLLSIAFAPDFASSGHLYVDYAQNDDGVIHVAELTASGSTAPVSSLRELLAIQHPGESNHNGGQLQFGPDGFLYISTGDGGGRDDEHQNAQKLDSLLGKLLRIDPRPTGLLPYGVPAGNPFPAAAAPADTIWSYGLRNPFRFSFDRVTKALVIGDVGQDAREEVDYVPFGIGAGFNFGWSCREGLIAGPALDPKCTGAPADAFVEPIFEYPHADPGGGAAFGCAIIGGYVARDENLGDLYGRYLYGDTCTGELRSFNPAATFGSDRSEHFEVPGLSSFGEDGCGHLYAVSGLGKVLRLTGPEAVPVPAAQSNASAGASADPCAAPVGPKLASRIGIRAQSRKVRRNRKALITVVVAPCNGRRGDPVRLLRGGRRIASRRLDRACTAHFRPRIRRKVAFRASVAEDETYVSASSRKLKIRISKRKAPQGRAGKARDQRARWP